MTEKRFELIPYGDITYGLFDWVKKEYVAEHLPIRFEGIWDILNELAEENMMLKGENAHYKLLLMSLEETARKFCEIPKVKK